MIKVPGFEGTKAPAAAVAAAPTQVTSAVPVEPPSDPMRLVLTAPFRTHKGEIRELNFRLPVGRDYIGIGALPFDIRGGMEDRRVVIDYAKSAAWIAALSGHDEILIGGLPREDFLGAVAKVNDLLMGEGVDKMGNSIG